VDLLGYPCSWRNRLKDNDSSLQKSFISFQLFCPRGVSFSRLFELFVGPIQTTSFSYSHFEPISLKGLSSRIAER